MLRNSYLVFLDILGYSQLIKTLDSKKELEIELKKLLYSLEKAKGFLEPHNYWKIKFFTDNVIIQNNIKVLDGTEEGPFGTVAFSINSYQFIMVLNGYFIRGGWSLGDSYIDDNIVFGKPLIEAHSIESEQAIFPRIMLSNDMKKLVDKHLSYYAKDYFPPQASDLLKEDGKYFMNYLITVKYFEIYDQKRMLLKHKRNIEKNLCKWNENDKIFAKYLWAAEYHNYFIKTFTNFHETWLRVRISERIHNFQLLTNEEF